MFYDCKNLEVLDVSYFDTKYSFSFESMFEGCLKLESIDVSRFKSSQCITIKRMFKNCKALVNIDLYNWDMKNIGYNQEHAIDELFLNCKKLKNIKMNTNFEDINKLKIKDALYKNPYFTPIFQGIAKNGIFTYKKGFKCDFLLNEVPTNWRRIEK